MPLFLKAPADPTFRFTGRTIIITGSNTGLGFAAAQKFAKLDASRIILAVRDVQKGEVARQQILAVRHMRYQDEDLVVHVWKLDLADYESIKAFAERARTELSRIDVVVLNAGAFKRVYSQSKYGWEETLQVNVLSTTLLAILLLPVLQETAKKLPESENVFPVLEFVSSGLHKRVKLTEEETGGEVDLLDTFNKRDAYAAQQQYGRSKLLLMYAVQELSQRYSTKRVHVLGPAKLGSDVTSDTSSQGSAGKVHITSVCPGPCISDLARDYTRAWYGPVVRVLMQFLRLVFLRTAEEGSRTYVSGVTLGEKGHGQFWQHDTIKE